MSKDEYGNEIKKVSFSLLEKGFLRSNDYVELKNLTGVALELYIEFLIYLLSIFINKTNILVG